MVVKLGGDTIDSGIEEFFSEDEIHVLELFWAEGELTLSQIKEAISSPNTAGVLDRLLRAEYVDRRVERIDGQLKILYSASASRDEVAVEVTARQECYEI